MGQKVHPLGFRVGITKKHQSQWFARFNKYAYSQSVVEDHMLRTTLTKLLPELLNPVLAKKAQKVDKNSSKQEGPNTPKITQIKIERGLIPYEIGIKIHAENCDLVKSALGSLAGFNKLGPDALVTPGKTNNSNNFRINRAILTNLQKTRHYLSKVVSPIRTTKNSAAETSNVANATTQKNTSSVETSNTSIFTKKRVFKKTLSRPMANNGRRFNGRFGKSASAGTDVLVTSTGQKKADMSRFPGKAADSRMQNVSSAAAAAKKGKNTKRMKKSQTRLMKMKKRLVTRQFIRTRYSQFLSKGLLIKKTGNTILRKVSCKSFVKNSLLKSGKNFKTWTGTGTGTGTRQTKNLTNKPNSMGRFNGRSTEANNVGLGHHNSNRNSQTNAAVKSNSLMGQQTAAPQVNLQNLALRKASFLTGLRVKKLSNKLSRKFATLYINKVNKNFLVHLKSLMKYWHKTSAAVALSAAGQSQTVAVTGLGLTGAPTMDRQGVLNRYNKKWGSLQKFKALKTKPLTKLINLVEMLEKKSLQKLFLLRKDFMVFGTISKTRSFGYYQLITFLKQLKELVNKMFKKQRNRTALNQLRNSSNNNISTLKPVLAEYGQNNSLKAKTSLTQNIFNKVANNFDNLQGRKVQLINYLQNMVRSHRQSNIFYYLSSMAVASKDLQELKRYTKKHSNFLFGISPTLLNVGQGQESSSLQEKIEKVLAQSNKKPDFEKNLQDAFLEQVESQRKMYKANLALTPKISIKFFSVKADNILEKASVVADTIVDALEKRKAFRGVIKKAKEDLMRRLRVKGVKIQVAGRLNGAEIARSEWVRAGRVPLQTLRANIDYSYRTASTIYGIIGVKVWIFKGYY